MFVAVRFTLNRAGLLTGSSGFLFRLCAKATGENFSVKTAAKGPPSEIPGLIDLEWDQVLVVLKALRHVYLQAGLRTSALEE